MILSDNETKIDMLNNKAIAQTIVNIIGDCDDRPISIGVHGDWGAGKSSVLAMIEDELSNNKDGIKCIRFNGWKHQGFEDSKIALMNAIVSELAQNESLTKKGKDAVKKLWKNINWLNVAKKAGSLAYSFATGIPPINMLTGVIDKLKSSVGDQEKISSAVESVGGYLDQAKIFDDNSISKEFAEFQESFEELLQDSKIKKLVVLIDDLDRCLPNVTIETLEAIRLFLFTKSTAFVIAADEAMIEYAVRNHFPDLPEDKSIKTGYEYSQRYLEKIIQVPFRIPTLGKIESETYITLLLIGSKLKEDDDEYLALLGAALNKMKKPWENTGFLSREIKELVGDKYDSISEQVSISNQISDILAQNTQGNPRKIKRFINMLLLRKQISDARGFGQDIQLEILAKLMLVEHFMPKRYREIVNALNDSDGKCYMLAEAEKKIAQQNGSEETTDAKENEDALAQKEILISIDTWEDDKGFQEWIQTEPLLGNIDLRPYFFASKGSEDLLFSQARIDRLRELVFALMGSTMTIASRNDEIKNLTAQDAEKVFDLICHKIKKIPNYSTQPSGIHGLIALVSVHEDLELKLVMFIESFDCTKVGAWICKGWDKAIKSRDMLVRLEEYKKKLRKDGSALVKAALSADN